MKRKFIALALCMALVMSIAVPSTLAMGIASDSSNYDMAVEANAPEDAVLPEATPVADNAESTPDVIEQPTDEAATAQPDASAEPAVSEPTPAASAEPTPEVAAPVKPDASATPAADAEQPKEPTNTATPEASKEPAATAEPVQVNDELAQSLLGLTDYETLNKSYTALTDAQKASLTAEQLTAIDSKMAELKAKKDAADALYNNLLNCTTFEDAQTVATAYDEATGTELISSMSADQQAALNEHLTKLFNERTVNDSEEVLPAPTVNYTHVAKFVPLLYQMMPLAADSNLPPDEKDNGVEFTKTVTPNDDGSFKITLDAFTTGKVSISSETKPSDIVLVLDRSTSMKEAFSNTNVYKNDLNLSNKYYVTGRFGIPTQVTWCTECNAWTDGCDDFWGHRPGNKYYPKESPTDRKNTQFYERLNRMEALHSAATKFVDSVAENSPESRISVVSFGQRAYIHNQLLTVNSNAQEIKNNINGIRADEGATEHGRGMVEAQNVIQKADPSHNRVVVMITDGEPAPSGTNKWSSRVVKQAVNTAYEMKQDSVSVYCVSVMPGTNAQNPTEPMDQYMSYVSSNYPNAQYTGHILDDEALHGDSYYSGSAANIIKQIIPGQKIDTTDGSFYLTANDVDALDSIFDQIASQSGGSTTSLGTSTVIRDVVTPYFDMPANSDVTVEAFDCLSYTEATKEAVWKDTPTSTETNVTIRDKTVDVSGFDFDRNFVAENGRVEGNPEEPGNFHGRKLVITFNVKPSADFMGGNGVSTNESAGIYEKADSKLPVETAGAEPVNVPVATIIPDAKDQYIYLSNSFDPATLVQIDKQINGTNNAFVDVTYTISDRTGKPVATCKIENGMSSGTWVWEPDAIQNPNQDVRYTVTCTVDGTNGKAKNRSSDTASANVFVLTPVITWKDSRINLGDTADYMHDNGTNVDYNFVSEKWLHNNKPIPDGATVIGTQPTLTYDFDPLEAAFEKDTDVRVTVKIGDEDVTNHVTFINHSTTHTADSNHQFTVYVEAYTLTIQKTANAPGVFKFHVKDDKNAVDMDLVIEVTADTINTPQTVTIKGLPQGTYTVTEDTNWSWNFTANEKSQTVVLTGDTQTGTAAFINTLNDKWLNDSVCVKNVPGMSIPEKK